jgi:multimeric flavodoxin WrbA
VNKPVSCKVLAIVGSARKGNTYKSAQYFLEKLKNLGPVDGEIIRLYEMTLNVCRGCKQCLDKGEDHCPLKDSFPQLVQKMISADGVVFASPNYSFHVSGIMKVFLDRMGYVFHRPRFFGKIATSIVVQGVYGGGKILNYFNFIANALGFNSMKGLCLTTREPISVKNQKRNNSRIEKLATRFYGKMVEKQYPVPGLKDLALFRFSRSIIGKTLDETYIDYRYYQQNGWLKSDYFYPVKMGPFKRIIGKSLDRLARIVA